jgi:hypothetical protein
MANPKVRPLINTRPVSEFGEFEASEVTELMGGLVEDNTFVPGWSELRRERDIALGEVVQGRRLASDVPALPVNVRLVRRSGASGVFDGKKLMSATNQGYMNITKEHIGQDWFTAMPPGAKVLEDGSIVNAAGDMQYMYCHGPRAALNLKRKQERTRALADMAGQGVAGGVVQHGGSFDKEPPT